MENPVIATISFMQGRESFALHSDYSISRPAINLGPSGKWKATGLYLVKGGYYKFAMTIEKLIENLKSGKMNMLDDWAHKNGAGKYYLGDLDHGTSRIQGNAIKYIVLR